MTALTRLIRAASALMLSPVLFMACGTKEDVVSSCLLGSCGDAGGYDGSYAPPSEHCGASGQSGASGVSCVSGNTGDYDGAISPLADASVPAPDVAPQCESESVTFKLKPTGPASSVWVTGTMVTPAWSLPAKGALELMQGSDGTWELTQDVPKGDYQYKYVLVPPDGLDKPNTWLWLVDEAAEVVEQPNDMGGVDRNNAFYVCAGLACGDDDWRDAVMYFALTDRFFDSDGTAATVAGVSADEGQASGKYKGGDLKGVTAKLPYLADLGVTALWLGAPYRNRQTAGASSKADDSHSYSAYHGYWPSPLTTSFSADGVPDIAPEVDSRIGTNADLKQLIAAAHAEPAAGGTGIKVLFDYVMHHVDADSALYKAHGDWFHGTQNNICGSAAAPWDLTVDGKKQANKTCAFEAYLPTFDFNNAAARGWSVRDAVYWAKEYGVDGLRLDAIKHVEDSWLTELRTRVDAQLPEPRGGRFYMVGETFDWSDRGFLKSFIDPSTKLDGQFDFPWRYQTCSTLFYYQKKMRDLAAFMVDNDAFYGAGALMSTWVGNHDIPRAIHYADQDPDMHDDGNTANCYVGSDPGENGWRSDEFSQPTNPDAYKRLALGFALMLTSPGVPLIYYGDEIGLAGGGDPDNRRPMPWDASLSPAQTSLREQVKALANLRGKHRALSRGKRYSLAANDDLWAYRMDGCAESITVVINRGGAASVQSNNITNGAYTDLMTGETVTISGGTIPVAALGFRVLALGS